MNKSKSLTTATLVSLATLGAVVSTNTNADAAAVTQPQAESTRVQTTTPTAKPDVAAAAQKLADAKKAHENALAHLNKVQAIKDKTTPEQLQKAKAKLDTANQNYAKAADDRTAAKKAVDNAADAVKTQQLKTDQAQAEVDKAKTADDTAKANVTAKTTRYNQLKADANKVQPTAPVKNETNTQTTKDTVKKTTKAVTETTTQLSTPSADDAVEKALKELNTAKGQAAATGAALDQANQKLEATKAALADAKQKLTVATVAFNAADQLYKQRDTERNTAQSEYSSIHVSDTTLGNLRASVNADQQDLDQAQKEYDLVAPKVTPGTTETSSPVYNPESNGFYVPGLTDASYVPFNSSRTTGNTHSVALPATSHHTQAPSLIKHESLAHGHSLPQTGERQTSAVSAWGIALLSLLLGTFTLGAFKSQKHRQN